MSSWTFLEPYRLLLLLLLPVIILVSIKYGRKRAPAILVSQLNTALHNKNRISPPLVFLVLRILTMVCLVVAMAEPAMVIQKKVLSSAADIDIVMALDVSGSMQIEDLKPNRLEALKDVVARFTAARSHDRFGLVLYARESVVWSPLTHDSRYLRSRISELNNKEMADGTAIGLGLASAVNVLKGSKAKDKLVILLTDGENNAGFIHPLTASAIAKKYGIKVHTIGIGTTGKAPMPVTDMDGHKTYQYVDVKLDEPLLRKMARQTGGNYFRATDAGALKNIYATIDRLEKTKPVISYQESIHALYPVFAGLAAFFLLLEVVLSITIFKTFN